MFDHFQLFCDILEIELIMRRRRSIGLKGYFIHASASLINFIF
jgi:hypothetical protein